MNPEVDWFFDKPTKWQMEYALLRTLVLECGLTEELKWGCPCYTLGEKNIVLIHGFKDYCALLFMKGALLKDLQNILVQQTQNVQAARQVRFANVEQIKKQQPVLKRYIKEAISVEKAGLKVNLNPTPSYSISQEFEAALKDAPELKQAFEKLTPGRQRAYLLYFSAPKQSKTRETRIEKYFDKILQGKGMDD